METRKIAAKARMNIIIWGKRIKGMFKIAEGYYLKEGYNRNPKTKKWDNIWKTKTWPKVAFFTWILSHR